MSVETSFVLNFSLSSYFFMKVETFSAVHLSGNEATICSISCIQAPGGELAGISRNLYKEKGNWLPSLACCSSQYWNHLSRCCTLLYKVQHLSTKFFVAQSTCFQMLTNTWNTYHCIRDGILVNTSRSSEWRDLLQNCTELLPVSTGNLKVIKKKKMKNLLSKSHTHYWMMRTGSQTLPWTNFWGK